jgi:hypothetical protein
MPEESVQTETTAPAQASESRNGFGESTDADQARTIESVGDGEKPAGSAGPQKPKELSRYEKAKRHRAALAQREVYLQRKEQELAQKEQAAQEQAKKPKYSLEELQAAREDWEKEGNFDLVERADKEIKKLQAEALAQQKASKTTLELPRRGTPAHKAMWEAAEGELARVDPEFMRAGTRLDAKLREILSGQYGDVYRDHAQGIYAAYDRARRELLEEDKKELQTELSKIKEELKRYQGYTSIDGGAPGQVGAGGGVRTPDQFRKLSLTDMKRYLQRDAARSPRLSAF